MKGNEKGRKGMNRQVQIWISGVAGLVLAAVLVLVASASAGSPPPIAPATQSRAASAAAASWSSSWVPITRNQTITFDHKLGSDPNDYAVELWFKDLDGLGINHRGYGGLEVNGHWYGAHWQNLTANTIQVHRQPDDNAADLIRVRVWEVPDPPDYDSEWVNINQGETITISHNVGITAEDLTVGLWFSGTVRGIHHFAFGGLAVDGLQRMLGAHWQNLTTNTVQVIRHPHDTDAEQVRVIAVAGAPPDYDSGWQSVVAGDKFTFTHSLNWDPDLLLVRGECYDPTGLRGIHQLFAGGNHDWFDGGHFQGVSLENLTNNTVTVFRQPDDEFCPQIRTRIWKRGPIVYLPLVVRDSP